MADAEAEADTEVDTHENKDDTGVGNPWGLSGEDADDGAIRASGSGSTGLLTKVGN